MSKRYMREWAPEHALSNGRGEVLTHRLVLYAAIGPGSHPCHFCGVLLTWVARRGQGGQQPHDLVVEHLNGDTLDNRVENLVPSCQRCNIAHGYSEHRVSDEELFVTRVTGTRLRGVGRTCAQCGADFVTPTSADGRYCSRRCASDSFRKDVCRRGHPRTPSNLSAAGACRQCVAIASAKHNEKRREARRLARQQR